MTSITPPVGLFPTSITAVAVGGTPVTIMFGPVAGGIIMNPFTAADQGLAISEVLYVDVVGPATISKLTALTGGSFFNRNLGNNINFNAYTANQVRKVTPTTVAIQPGQMYFIPKNLQGNVSVNAATSGHKFSAVTFQPQSPAIPGVIVGGTNPCLQDILPSYLYQQYANDDDLQAFVNAYNSMAQQYLDWFNDINLPIYTGPLITGTLLDWIGYGLYGVRRPLLSAGNSQVQGPFNTYALNGLAFNARHVVIPSVFTPVNDDIFKRVLTWKLFKGDGKQIDIRWLKRRILRFLLGANGTDVNTADTRQISITFGGNQITITNVVDNPINTAKGPFYNSVTFNGGGFNLPAPLLRITQSIETFTRDNQVNINLLSQVVTAISGANFNTFLGNSQTFNGFGPTAVQKFSPLPNTAIFKQAVDQGVLDMPFQFKTVVNIR